MAVSDEFPRALSAPAGDLVVIGTAHIQEAAQAARRSPRRRVILPFHKSSDDTLHRMLNALEPCSYVQPHRHIAPPKPECLIVLGGALGYVSFAPDGAVYRCFVVRAGSDAIGIDIQPGIYHTFFALEENTVIFEVKPGPYEPMTDKDFAPWAPREGDPEAASYLAKLYDLVDRLEEAQA